MTSLIEKSKPALHELCRRFKVRRLYLFGRAGEREFEIIGEALGRLSMADPNTADRIDELPRIVGFRKPHHSRL